MKDLKTKFKVLGMKKAVGFFMKKAHAPQGHKTSHRRDMISNIQLSEGVSLTTNTFILKKEAKKDIYITNSGRISMKKQFFDEKIKGRKDQDEWTPLEERSHLWDQLKNQSESRQSSFIREKRKKEEYKYSDSISKQKMEIKNKIWKKLIPENKGGDPDSQSIMSNAQIKSGGQLKKLKRKIQKRGKSRDEKYQEKLQSEKYAALVHLERQNNLQSNLNYYERVNFNDLKLKKLKGIQKNRSRRTHSLPRGDRSKRRPRGYLEKVI